MSSTTYTFKYCRHHDQGWVVQGNVFCLPSGFNYCESTRCTPTDWYTHGIIRSDGYSFSVVENVTTSLEEYAGGFEFFDFMDSVVDTNGKPVIVEKNSLLHQWFKRVEYKSHTNSMR